MRVVFLGNAPWSVPSLEAIARSSHDLVKVATRAPRRGGRGNQPIPTAVAEAARRLGLPLQEVETVKSGPGFEALAEAQPEVLVVVAYGEIVPKTVLDLPSVAPVNVHFSLLPKLRGAAPVQRAIMQGLGATGVTTMRMDEGMDTGRVLLQSEEPIHAEDDAGSLGQRLAVLGGRLLMDTLEGLASGSIEERTQEDAQATFAPKLKAEDRVIDWLRPADEVVRLVRAMAPSPGATTTFRGKGLKILRAEGIGLVQPPSGPPGHSPGTMLSWKEHPLAVVTGDGRMVELHVVQPEGRRAMSGGEFVRGYRPEDLEALGGAGATRPPG